jgi:predicted RND superfamily exporter protein
MIPSKLNPGALYLDLVLRRPRLVILAIALLTLVMLWFARDFRLDASADSLVVDGDADLDYSREISKRYGGGDFVFVVYTPREDLFSQSVLEDLGTLRTALAGLERVASVDSIFSVPLFKVAGSSLSDVADNILTLEQPGLDLEAVRADLTSNRAYRDVLLSADGRTTALVVNFSENEALTGLQDRREALRALQRDKLLAPGQAQELAQVERDYQQARTVDNSNLHSDITAIREILDGHRGTADIAMGGVPMIADDLVSYVRKDLGSFGIAILLFIVAALWFFFRRVRYVVLPLLCGAVITIVVIGLLGLLDWPATVISSNFISLLLIITVSLTVHLIVRYRELQVESPGESHERRLQFVLRSMVVPCFYTSLTTMVAFGSLVVSDIPPVVDFGLMMVLGVLCAFTLTFLLFPALLALLPAQPLPPDLQGFDITPRISNFTERRGMVVVLASLVLLVGGIAGISRLRVENSFIDYFDEQTDIYQGMVTIDERMGGTTPLDVIIDLARPNPFGDDAGFDAPAGAESGWEGEEWEDDEWAEEEEGGTDPDSYWFTADKMATITRMHDWLDALPETGKVLSLATLLQLAYELNGDRELNSFELGILYNRIPPEYKESLLRPYVSVADNQVRFSLRIRESDPGLNRSALLEQIRSGMQAEFGLAPEQVHLSGMLVLYNNMLQSLFESQIESISVVMGAIFLMFIVLFRSFWVAVLGIIPNVLAALTVLGIMGLTGIPLDMMTITIAAVAIGIGVDNTIHYVHRFQHNFPHFRDYLHTMHYCHGSIGKGIYYTNFSIIAGFSILVLSNFVPTVTFGLLTSLAMLLALAGALTLLPWLLVRFKPLGPEGARLN